MHMADALLSPSVGVAMWAVSAGTVAYSTKKITNADIFGEKLPIMAVSGAFVFAAQMINFTIPGTGSSGHIGGGILLAALLGEFPALITLSSVLVIQCLFFADGGLLALGANIFNMGIIPCLIVYPLIFRPLLKKRVTKGKIITASIISPVIGLQLGAFCVVLETLISGITELPFKDFLILMQPIHLAIGFGEGLVTAAVLAFIWNMRPELIKSAISKEKMEEKVTFKKVIIILAIMSVLLGGGLSLYASSNPDGLEWSMEKVLGTARLNAKGTVYNVAASIQEKLSIFPGYDFKAGKGTGTGASGIIGSIITAVLALGCGLAITLVKRNKKNE